MYTIIYYKSKGTRWENARVLQTKAADDLLRLMERLPAVVEALREIRALAVGQSSASVPRLGKPCARMESE